VGILNSIGKTIKEIFQGFKSGIRTLYELFRSLAKSKFWWLAPMLLALVLCGVFLVVVNTVTTTMPFVYALF
jgi:hypothetical protein